MRFLEKLWGQRAVPGAAAVELPAWVWVAAGCVMGAGVWWRFGWSAQAAEFGVLFLLLLLAAWADLRWRILPNELVLLGLANWVFFLFLSGEASSAFMAGMVDMLGLCVPLAVAGFISRGGIGSGDIKLFCLLACYFGFYAGVNLVALACLLGLVFSFALRTLKKVQGRTFALGPAIVLAAWLVMLAG